MYTHPGKLFVERYGEIDGSECVKQFASFLREEANVGHEPPIDLSRIYIRFGIPTPQHVPLIGQQGLLVNPDFGIILIEERDIETRQRFTEAHELMELLFSTLPNRFGQLGQYSGMFKPNTKERLCNEGAAELLMPEASFSPRLARLGVSFKTARKLATGYDVSLSAALGRIVRLGTGRHAIVLWSLKNKPTEIRNKIPSNQLSFLEASPERIAPKKLRVEWSFTGSSGPFIPPNKSVPEDSSIFSAWKDGTFTTGSDRLSLGSINGTFRCENLPFEIEGERQVISLLHYPGEKGCQP